MTLKGKPYGLVVTAEDSQSEPWPLDMGSNPGFTQKLNGKNGSLNCGKTVIKTAKQGKSHQKNIY